METVNSIINWILGFLTAGTITIILVSLLQIIRDQMQLESDNREQYIKRIKNAIIFLIVAFAIFGIKDIVFHYFGTPTFQTY